MKSSSVPHTHEYTCVSPTDERQRQVLTARLSSSRHCGENTDNRFRSVWACVNKQRVWVMRVLVRVWVTDGEGTEEGCNLEEGVDMGGCV